MLPHFIEVHVTDWHAVTDPGVVHRVVQRATSLALDLFDGST
jgi:hypothetical protein